VFPMAAEEGLVRYCLVMEQIYELCTKDAEREAHCLAIRVRVRRPFQRQKKETGRQWLKLFLG